MSKKNPSSKIMFKNLVEHMNEAVWVGDENERTVYANPKFCQMVGYSLEEIMGWESYVFWDPESAKKVKTVNEKDRRKGKSSSYEGYLVSKQGSRVPVLLSGSPLPNGGTIGIMTDLSDLKKKNEEYQILYNAIEHSSEALIILDKQGNVVLWNQGARLIFGYRKDERLGKNLAGLFSETDQEIIHTSNKEYFQFNAKASHKTGGELQLDVTVSKQKDYLLLIIRDLSGHHRFEQEMSTKYQKLKEAYNQFGILQREMEYVFDLFKEYEKHENKKFFLNYVVNSVLMLSKADACVLRLYNEDRKTLDLTASSGTPETWYGKASIPYEKSLAQKAFEQKTPLRIMDLTQETRYRSAHLAKGAGLCSLLLIPLISRSKKVGSLSLYVQSNKKMEILENEYLEDYAGLISHLLGFWDA